MFDALPDEWRVTPLTELATIKTGKTPSTKDAQYWGGIVPFVTPSDLIDAPYVGEVERFLTDAGVAASTIAPTGSVLFTCIASIGKACILTERSTFNQQINACIPKPDVDSYFLFYALKARTEHFKDMAGTTAVPIINKSTFGRTPISLPPFNEQQRIAEVLRSVDEAILATSASIQQTTRVEQGLLHDLMTHGLHRLGGAPSDWEERKLSELLAEPLTYGVVQPGDYLKEGTLLVRGGDFPKGRIEVDDLPRISPDVTRSYQRSELRGGEILVSLVGYPGACAQVPLSLAGANISRSAALIRPNHQIDNDFLFHFIRSAIGQRRILRNSIGSAQQVVNLKDLKEVIVSVPPLGEQREIASILGAANECRRSQTTSLKSLQALKMKVASDLLSGRVRVPA
jgi:type I restriction enzyme S subunit